MKAMVSHNIFLYLIFTIYLINCGSALNADFIIGGKYVEPRIIKYQVSVQGRANFTSHYYHTCNGALVHEKYAVGVANCFTFTTIELKEITYYVFADTINLYLQRKVFSEIDKIYMTTYHRPTAANDIVVMGLNPGFVIHGSANLQTVALPAPNQQFPNRVGVVTGYGYDWLHTLLSFENGTEYVIQGGSKLFLKAAMVQVLDDEICQKQHPTTTTSKHVCGLMLPDDPRIRWGICSGDSGSPLVVAGILVGLASRGSSNCDDTKVGALYTKVSLHVPFIQSVINGSPIPDTFIYENRPHIENPITQSYAF